MVKEKNFDYYTGILITALLFTIGLGCGKKSEDSEDETTAAATSTSSPTSSASSGSLALAFPSDLKIGSALMGSSSSSSLALQTIDTYTTPKTIDEKDAVIDAILEATSLDECFAIQIGNFTQPSCFAPNAGKVEIEAAASSSNPYIITYDSNFSQLLYGDGGIVKTSEESGESCTAATIGYFTEDALQFIEQGKQLFASLVCASKFVSDVSLPDVGESVDYAAVLSQIPVPSGTTFDSATISKELSSAGNDVYTTSLALTFVQDSSTRKLYAYFRHEPGDTSSRGHVVVMNAGIGNPLNEANNLHLNTPNPPDPNDPSPPPPQDGNPTPPDGGNMDRIGVVSISYKIDGNKKYVILDRGNFATTSDSTSADRHPKAFVKANGRLDLAASGAIDPGNNFADNFVTTKFILDPDASEVIGKGVVGWTASLNDGFWRSFAYSVHKDSDGNQTAKSTFGFAPSYNSQTGAVAEPTAALGMFCYWAQGGGNQTTTTDSTKYLEASGLSGAAVNKVQYQVSQKTASSQYFSHSETDSHLKFKVASDCGSGSDNALIDIQSDGGISGEFEVPTIDAFSELGGITVSNATIDLNVD